MPRDFDLVICHDVRPEVKWMDPARFMESESTPKLVSISDVSIIVKKGGYLLHSVPVFGDERDISKGYIISEAERIGQIMKTEVEEAGFECLETGIVGDLESYLQNKRRELNVGVFGRRIC
jgi:hypothetical protein